jgi:hypothetical protein
MQDENLTSERHPLYRNEMSKLWDVNDKRVGNEDLKRSDKYARKRRNRAIWSRFNDRKRYGELYRSKCPV